MTMRVARGAVRRAHGAQPGQATVELVATAPLVLLCGVIGLQALAAGANFVYADHAAEAAAIAALRGEDAAGAARRALPVWSRGRVSVRAGLHRVTVTLRPRALLGPLAGLLEVGSSAAFAPRER